MNNNVKYRIADAHAHIFPEKIAQKAVNSIGNFYDLEMWGNGLATQLIESGNAINVEKYLVCSTATVKEQVVAINDFIVHECSQHPQFVGFATLHPDFEDIEYEVARVKELGLRGIKLHSDFQKFDIDEGKAISMYRKIAKAGLPILFHMGDNRYDYSMPKKLGKVARAIPELLCIAAHFGGYNRWDDVEDALVCPNIVFDTSSSLFALTPERAVELIQYFGCERFMFGTDYPMWNHQEEFSRFMNLPLTEEQRRAILWDNFARIYNID